MFTAENPGCSGAAARLPKNPGSQKLTPPSSACDACGTSVPMTSAAAKPTPAIHRVISCCFMTLPRPHSRVPPTLLVADERKRGRASNEQVERDLCASRVRHGTPHDRHDTPASTYGWRATYALFIHALSHEKA